MISLEAYNQFGKKKKDMVISMELRPGEKASGVVRSVKEDGFVIELRNEVKGFAERECDNGVDQSGIERGSEVKVEVTEIKDEEMVALSIIEVFSQDKYLKKPDKYLENVSAANGTSCEETPEEKVSDELEEWFNEAEKKLKEVKKHRKERLNKDFWVP